MKVISLALLAAVCGFGQAGRLDGGNVNGPNFTLYWETRLEPATPALAQNLGMSKVWGDGAFTRILMDRARRMYFGYRMTVSLRGDGSYAVAWTPRFSLTSELARVTHIDDPEAWKQVSGWGAWEAPGQKVVRLGDVIALDLMTNPDTGQKIVDYISIQEPFRQSFFNFLPREFSYVAGAARDFRTEDAELHLREPRLSVNGKVDPTSTTSLAEPIGPAIWLYAPGKGRFVLSLTPRAGFQKAGEVRGTSLSFKVGSDTFTVSSAVRIAPGDAPFNLYVLHEPAWRPVVDTFQVGIGP